MILMNNGHGTTPSATNPEGYTILADHGDPDCFVGRRFRIDGGLGWLDSQLWRQPGFRIIRMVLRGTLAWFRVRRFDGPKVVVTYGAGLGFVLAFWQALFKPLMRPVTHFMFDLLLDKKRSGLGGLFDDIKTWIFNTAVSGAVIWGKSDVPRFSTEFGLQKEKLFFHPYHITLDDLPGFQCDVKDEGYAFCGGNVGRDFKSVIEAFGPLGIPLKIATQVPGIKELAEEYPNIQVEGVTPVVFRHLLARSSFTVESHPREFFRTAGHQTMLNAHYLGKPVILVDRGSAEGYVRDGVDGYVLSAEDVGGIRQAARSLWEDRDLRTQMAAKGQAKATRPLYATLNHMQSVYSLAIRHDCRRRGVSYRDQRLEIY